MYNFDDEVVVASIQHLLNVRVSRIQNRLTKLETFGIKRVNKENDFTFKPSSRREVPLQVDRCINIKINIHVTNNINIFTYNK